MSGTLFVVATPIGNLEDITLRAVRLLREADVIAAEDTRRTARLLAHYAISTPTTSFHEHNTRSRVPQLLARLARGERVALVTDAGTPGISDPGIELVRACLDAGIAVDPIPGASAPLAAAVASGFPLEPLTILGFVPSRSKDRKAWIDGILSIPHTVVFFEAPHRVRETLREFGLKWVERQIFVARELTKVHQEFLMGRHPADIVGRITNLKGEFTVVVGPRPEPAARHITVNTKQIAVEFGQITDLGPGGRRQAVASLAKRHGLSNKEIYLIIENEKSSGL